MGREHTEIEGVSFMLEKIILFEVWIKKNYSSFDSFLNLKDKDKEKIFLRWKWGLSDESNPFLESSERHTLHILQGTDLSRLSEALQYYFNNKVAFDKYCKEVREQIGLVYRKTEELPEVAQQALSIFDGRVVD